MQRKGDQNESRKEEGHNIGIFRFTTQIMDLEIEMIWGSKF